MSDGMKSKRWIIGAIVLVGLVVNGCTAIDTGAEMEDAAEVYCRDLGYDTFEAEGPEGDTITYCVFAAGTACELLDFFYGDCAPERSICSMMGLAFDHGTSPDGRTRTALCVFTDGTSCTVFDYALLGDKCQRVREVNACAGVPGGLCP